MTTVDRDVMNRVIKYLLTEEGVKYSVHYVDNDDETWSVPVLLTEDRAEKLIDDVSMDKIRFTFPDSNVKATFTL